ncbi:MAG TPA: TPM domain-containing protein [Bacteroidales bacterium]|mgnify:CR=1 FL=1|jgi:uncharacterized membrane protein|nr:TPM domain-containing protein [Bacteroidales bacterium]
MFVRASRFFTKEQQDQIREAIKKAESETSGEIRVHIETWLTGSVLDRAAWVFRKIGMHTTNDRNGILFYLAVQSKQFAVIGDAGINEKVTEEFWKNIKDVIQAEFRDKKYMEGLIAGILMAGHQLKKHFPRKADDINELPDEISFETPE